MINNNLEKFNKLRDLYPIFIFKNYEINNFDSYYEINYYYSINNQIDFCNTIKIYKKYFKYITDINSDYVKNIIFNLGIVEGISYYKTTCSPIYKIECGTLDSYQKDWWQKLIYNGLGELRYVNGFSQIPMNEFIIIEALEDNTDNTIPETITKNFKGNLIPIGGGKDSIVTLELLKKYNNTPFMFFHKRVASYETCITFGFKHEDIFEIDRYLDDDMLEMNKKGYINGHVPISAMIAFSSYLATVLLGKKYIVLSNEASSNEGNIPETNINHQYSKSFEFESDFNNYATKYFSKDIQYFSLLRPISEYQITKQLAKYPKYLPIFKSCNAGIKENKWCNKCSKCLFVYSLLLPIIGEEKTIKIFNSNLLNDIELNDIFEKLIGIQCEKPFECVGTKEEILFGLKTYIKNNSKLPTLLEKHKEYIQNYNISIDFNTYFNNENLLPEEYLKILKKEIL